MKKRAIYVLESFKVISTSHELCLHIISRVMSQFVIFSFNIFLDMAFVYTSKLLVGTASSIMFGRGTQINVY